jgi:hypothetical protein
MFIFLFGQVSLPHDSLPVSLRDARVPPERFWFEALNATLE